MNYKDLKDHGEITEMRDNGMGHFTQKCPWCGKMQMQITTDSGDVPRRQQNRGRCHNTNCPQYHVWFSIKQIDTAQRRFG